MKKYLVIRIGVIVTITIAMLIWGFNFLKGRQLLTPEVSYFAVYKKVDGLGISSPVMINGFKVGYVRHFTLLSDTSSNLIVDLAIAKKYKLRIGTIAQIYSIDIMGTKAVKLIQGKSDKYHKAHDTIMSSIEGDLKDQVEMTMAPLKYKIENLLSSFDSVLTIVTYIFNKRTQENLSRSFANINKTIINLEQTTTTLNDMVAEERERLHHILLNVETITSNLQNNNSQINLILSNMNSITDSISHSQFKSAINNANTALQNIAQITQKINQGQGSIGELINNDTLYRNLENASLNLNKLLKDVKDNPKRYVHFSAFDMGKTIVVKDSTDFKKKKKK